MNKYPTTLAINTTTRYCSVALLVGDKEFVAEEYSERGHEGIILSLMDQVFAESHTTKQDVELLAFGRGPGAFTGIRVATATAQGLAFGLNLPVVPVSDLLNISFQHFKASEEKTIAACVDARMDEIYAAIIEWSDHSYEYIKPEALLKPDDFQCESSLCGVGNG
ncbi:MAG: tRNA (adenosine(37)-N6)-threonylcarbamoyltransferase complex dimerization subunit type 1 TsaB, partial [Gammaproteobacteria bacterium]|nr:tRNA (adenosine(37)-N6)-threonylcarbamoyltransferase complex dimerization subunit type 1 TsaB [Gammaproteobacteria bacterium]